MATKRGRRVLIAGLLRFWGVGLRIPSVGASGAEMLEAGISVEEPAVVWLESHSDGSPRSEERCEGQRVFRFGSGGARLEVVEVSLGW